MLTGLGLALFTVRISPCVISTSLDCLSRGQRFYASGKVVVRSWLFSQPIELSEAGICKLPQRSPGQTWTPSYFRPYSWFLSGRNIVLFKSTEYRLWEKLIVSQWVIKCPTLLWIVHYRGNKSPPLNPVLIRFNPVFHPSPYSSFILPEGTNKTPCSSALL